jgi:dynein heavy chain
VLPKPDYRVLIRALLATCRTTNLQAKDEFMKSIVQLYETVQVRHGLMLVGETGCGKTMVLRTLQGAMSSIQGDPDFCKVHVHSMNPKSITQGQLYGNFDDNTHEWTDGVLAVTYRNASRDTNPERHWIMFDGPVDAVWIENMNTVLDDNKMLCLNNGQRIKMPEICTMMFEVNDLKVASPATVSRCGMVYLEPVHLGWEVLVRTWTEEMVEFIVEPYLSMVSKILLEMLKKMLSVLETQITKEKIQTQKCNLVRSCLNFMQIFLNKERINLDNRDKIRDPEKVVLTYLAFSVIWSLGANVHDEQRTLFGEYFRGQMQTKMPDFPNGDVFEFGINPQTH